MSTTSTYTTSPSFDDYVTGKNRLVLNVEMSFLRDQLASQTLSTLSRTNPPTTSVSRMFSNEPLPKFKRTFAYQPEVRKSHPLDIYFKSESGRRKVALEKKYSPWTYYNGSEFPDDDTLPAITPQSKGFLPEIYEDRCERRVGFATEGERLPNITPISRNFSPENKFLQNACDVLFISQTPPTKMRKPKSNPKAQKKSKQNDADTNMYNISFTPNTRGQYDPSSELHSDYYTIKRIDSQANIRCPPCKRLEAKPTPSRYRFSAILIGTRKYLHRRNQIECDGYMSVPLDEWSMPNPYADRAGYSSVPLRKFGFPV